MLQCLGSSVDGLLYASTLVAGFTEGDISKISCVEQCCGLLELDLASVKIEKSEEKQIQLYLFFLANIFISETEHSNKGEPHHYDESDATLQFHQPRSAEQAAQLLLIIPRLLLRSHPLRFSCFPL